MAELVVPRERQLDRDAERLDRHDRHGSHRAADAEVDERVLAPVARRHLVDHEGGEDGDDSAVEEEAGLDGVLKDFVDGGDFFVGRRVQDNDDGADEADGAADFAESA